MRNFLAFVLLGVSASSAHTIFCQLEAGGTTYSIGYGIRTPSYDGPITDVTSNDVVCNGGPNPTTPSDKIINVQAGSTVAAIWRHTLQSGPSDVMDASHLGPTMAYLKKVDDAVNDSGIGSGWFKIQEDGYSNGGWGTSKVINNGGKHYIDIPDCIPSGQYLLRAEMIALHAAGSYPGAQFYMECAQISITNGKGTKTPTTYSLPGMYNGSDPGITISIYSMTPSSKYTIPGPAVFSCGGSSNPPSSSSSSTMPATSTTMTTLTRTSATTTPTSSAPSGGCTQAKWGQCGGIGYSGCSVCMSGSTCVKQNDYYFQCQ